MKRAIVSILFLVGLGIFSYPMISNILSTKVHQSVVKEYEETIDKMDKQSIKKEKEKADKHNEKLRDSEIDFVDPFSTGGASKETTAGNKSYYDALNVGPAIGSLEIPKIDLLLPIYHGTSEEVLSRGVGHLENSSLPTGKPGTHSVLTAHRGLPSAELFRNLDDLTIGDQFYINVLNETFAYEVFDVDIVLPHQTEWLKMKNDEEIVTLLTCEPYMINTHRMLVKGKRVPYDPSKVESAEANDNLWIVIGLGIFFLLLVIWGMKRRKRRKQVEVR
ncbi:class C sortase [Cerasibacillus sp. JNUCC 74]|jgi:sortase A|uniref:class C sortase n=1 Tax=Virgibacillus proomii TaxID=84407 RepID=UPI0009848ED1|nr:class C sortase [Virgibacillus proomii]